MRVEIVGRDGLAAAEAAWADLAGRALERNVFYEPAFVLAAIDRLDDAGRPLFALVWDGSRLQGLFPLVMPALRLPWAMIRGWNSAYCPFTVPLVDAAAAGDVIAALFAHLSEGRRPAGAVLFPGIEAEGPFARALRAFAAATGRPVDTLGEYRRAALPAKDKGEDFMAASLRQKKLKDMRRLRRRLAETGTVTERSARTCAEVRDAVEHFLALEARGWKGKRGTAMMLDPRLATFARTALRQLAKAGRARIDVVELDGRPIAAGIVLESGPRAWYWKTAFDEDLARFSPGVMVTFDLTARQLAARRIALTDSCAVEGHPMIDHLWPDRIAIADVAVGLDPAHPRSAAAAMRRETLRRSARAKLKAAVRRVLGRK